MIIVAGTKPSLQETSEGDHPDASSDPGLPSTDRINSQVLTFQSADDREEVLNGNIIAQGVHAPVGFSPASAPQALLRPLQHINERLHGNRQTVPGKQRARINKVGTFEPQEQIKVRPECSLKTRLANPALEFLYPNGNTLTHSLTHSQLNMTYTTYTPSVSGR